MTSQQSKTISQQVRVNIDVTLVAIFRIDKEVVQSEIANKQLYRISNKMWS